MEPLSVPGPEPANTLDLLPPLHRARVSPKHLLLWMLITFLPPLLIIYGLHLLPDRHTSVFTLKNEFSIKGISALFVVLATWIVARMQRRPLDDYGIPPRQAFGVRFWEGMAWGFGMLSALLLCLFASGHFRIDSVALTGGSFLRYALEWTLAFLFVAYAEDFVFRGYLLFVLSQRIRFWRAAVALSVGFAAAHLPNTGETVLGILQVLGAGLLFCFMIRRTGNLWFSVGYHAAWDWAQTFFYGTANSGLYGEGHFLNSSLQGSRWISGGSVGPEGSIFSLLVILLCASFIHLRFPTALYPDRPA